MIKPEKLLKKDKIGIIAPAGAIKEPAMLDKAISNIKENGYQIELAPSLKKKKWYLAGEDKDRLCDLMSFFENPEIKAIFVARGGYGCMRLLDKIDYRLIRENPKIFLGYSDVTALHFAFDKYSDLITFHGPLTVSDFGRNTLSEFTWQNVWQTLEGKFVVPYRLENAHQAECINTGRVQGRILTGNLALMSALCGTRYTPDLHDRILFIEDIGESLYRIDRSLIHLKLAGVFNQVRGVVFGEFTDIVRSDSKEVNKLSPLDIIKDIFQDINIPVMYGFSCGHGENKTTIPQGVVCELDTAKGSVTILDEYLI